MKKLLVILFLFSAQLEAQILIPQVSFGFSINHDEFLAENNGLKVERTFILPEIYLGGTVVFDRWAIGLNYGVLQNTILMTTGFRINLKAKKKSTEF